MIVMYGSWETGEWAEINPTCYDIVPDMIPMPKYGCAMPCVDVRLTCGGLCAVFSRAGQNLLQRVKCVAFLPEKMIPLEMALLRTYICPVLPDELESLAVEEM